MEEKKKKIEDNKQKKNSKKIEKQKKSAFTLIELLAVIIILGVIMLIAIPSVTKSISSSRDKSYVATVKEAISSAKTLVNSGEVDVYDTNTNYYIPISCIETENSLRTPYGDFSKAYILVTYTGDGFDYYYTGTDTANVGIKKIVKSDDLDVKSIERNVKNDDINTNVGIDGRSNLMEFNEDCTNFEIRSVSDFYDSGTGEINETKLIEVIKQENEGYLSPGDEIVLGGKEHFNVISSDDTTTKLLAKYNLLVGYEVEYTDRYHLIGMIPTSTPGYGWQSELTTRDGYGVVPFAGYNYWQNPNRPAYFQTGYEDGYNISIYNGSLSTEAPQVEEVTNQYNFTMPKSLSNNYTIAYYVEPYLQKIRNMGVNILDGGLMSVNDAGSLGCIGNSTCPYNKNKFLENTSFWVASVAWKGSTNMTGIKFIQSQGSYMFSEYDSVSSEGVRPVIVINTNDIPLLGHDYFAKIAEEKAQRGER